MNKLIMRGEEYKITSNENQYDLEVHENTLFLKRGEEVYITLDLDKVCLGTKLEILKNMGITLERIAGDQVECCKNIESFKPLRICLEPPKTSIERASVTKENRNQRKYELYKILTEEIDINFKIELQKDVLKLLLRHLNEEIKKTEITPENFQEKMYNLFILKARIEKVIDWENGGSAERMIRYYNEIKASLGM